MADDVFALLRRAQAPILNHANNLLRVGRPPTPTPTSTPTTTVNPVSPESVRIVNCFSNGEPYPDQIIPAYNGSVPQPVMREVSSFPNADPIQSSSAMEVDVSNQITMDNNQSIPSVTVPSPAGEEIVISQNIPSPVVVASNIPIPVSNDTVSSKPMDYLVPDGTIPVSNDTVSSKPMDYLVPDGTIPVSNDTVSSKPMDYLEPSVETYSSSVVQDMNNAVSSGPVYDDAAAISNVGSDYGCSTSNGIPELTRNDIDKALEPFEASRSSSFDDNDSFDSLDVSVFEALKPEDIKIPIVDGLMALVFSLVSHKYQFVKNKMPVDTIEIPQIDGTVASVKFGLNRNEVDAIIFRAILSQTDQLKENLLKYQHTLVEDYFETNTARIDFIEDFCKSSNPIVGKQVKMTTIIEPVVEAPSSSSIGDNLIDGRTPTTEMEPIVTSDNNIGDYLNSTTKPISVGNTEIFDETRTIHTMPNPYAVTNSVKSTSATAPLPNSSKTSPSIDLLESIVTSVALEEENRMDTSSSVFDTPPFENDDDNDPYKFRAEEDFQKETETTINSLSKKRKRVFKNIQQLKKQKKSNNLNVNGDDGEDGGKNCEKTIKKGTARLESIRSELDTVDEIATDDEDDSQFNGLIDDDADREITYLLNKKEFDMSIFRDNREPGTSYKRIRSKHQEFKSINIKPRPTGRKTVKSLKLIFDSKLKQYEWDKDFPIKYPFDVDPNKIYTLDGVSLDAKVQPKTDFWIGSITELFRNKIHYTDFKHYSTNTSDDLVEYRLALGYVPLQYKPFCVEMFRMKVNTVEEVINNAKAKAAKNATNSKAKTAQVTTNPKAYQPYFYLGELEMLAYCYWELSTQDVLNMELTPTKKKAIKILLQQAGKDFKTMSMASEIKDEFDSFYFDFRNSCLFNNPEFTYIDMLAIKERFTEIYRFINESKLSAEDKEEHIWIWFNIFQQANCHHYLVPYTQNKCWAMLSQFVTHLEYFSQIPSNKFSLGGLKELSKTFIETVYGATFKDKNARSTVGSRILYFIDRFAYSFCTFSSLSVGLQSNKLNETNTLTIMANLLQINKKKGYPGKNELNVTISHPLVLLFSKLIRFYFYHYILMFTANGVSPFKTLNYKLTPELTKAFHFCLMEALKFLNKEILDKNEFEDGLKSIPFIGDIEKDFGDPAVFSETFKNSLFNYNLSLFKAKPKKSSQPLLNENAVAANTRKRKATEQSNTSKHIPIPSTSTVTNNNDPDSNDEDDDEPRSKIFKYYNDPDFWRGKENPKDKGENKCMLCYVGRSPRAFKFYQNCDDDTNNNFVLITVCSFCINCMKNNSSEEMKKLNSLIYERVKKKSYKAPLLYSITNKTRNEYTVITEPETRTITKATHSYELDTKFLKDKYGYTKFG